MPYRFNPPPGWPAPPQGWSPGTDWQPDPSWPAPPEGWSLWIEDAPSKKTLKRAANAKTRDVATNLVTNDSRAPGGGDELWRSQSKAMVGPSAGRYRLTTMMLFFEKGVLSTKAQQIPIADVWDVDVRQSMTQKARGVGDVILHVARPQGRELVVLEDIPDFREAQILINQTSHQARMRLQERQATLQNTHRYEHVQPGAPLPPIGAPQLPPPPPAPKPTQPALETVYVPLALEAAADPVEQLRRLRQVRDQDLITDSEYEAKKRDILERM
ncbi:MAG: hypothetical protein QOJ11_2368 [Frankiales bacterium]|jgi:hypothetical protein|nr:hypothetical protein [Frankiales bacterium]